MIQHKTIPKIILYIQTVFIFILYNNVRGDENQNNENALGEMRHNAELVIDVSNNTIVISGLTDDDRMIIKKNGNVTFNITARVLHSEDIFLQFNKDVSLRMRVAIHEENRTGEAVLVELPASTMSIEQYHQILEDYERTFLYIPIAAPEQRRNIPLSPKTINVESLAICTIVFEAKIYYPKTQIWSDIAITKQVRIEVGP